MIAIDTSTERLVLALQTRSGVITLDEPGAARASARLLPALLDMLARAGMTLADVNAIAFARGPGAFTGLRTACAVAQGLAFGAGKPVLPVDSLLIVAEDARMQADAGGGPFDVWVAMDARMQEVYAAAYRWREGGWAVLEPPRLCTPGWLAERWQVEPPQCVAGTALDAMSSQAAAGLAGDLPTGNAMRYPVTANRAAALMRIAQAAWQRGEAVDAALALPLYLRDKVAQTTAEREAARAAAVAAAPFPTSPSGATATSGSATASASNPARATAEGRPPFASNRGPS
jgi:tRNA threonylcarbamoyladenosine biosynthesis protein TsaB